jgi:hypothetical protein
MCLVAIDISGASGNAVLVRLADAGVEPFQRPPVADPYGVLTILSITIPWDGTLSALYESVEGPRSFWA